MILLWLNGVIWYKQKNKILGSWASTDFFPGEGAKIYHFPKKCLKAYFFIQKSRKNTILAVQGGSALPCGCPWLGSRCTWTRIVAVSALRSLPVSVRWRNIFPPSDWPDSCRIDPLADPVRRIFCRSDPLPEPDLPDWICVRQLWLRSRSLDPTDDPTLVRFNVGRIRLIGFGSSLTSCPISVSDLSDLRLPETKWT